MQIRTRLTLQFVAIVAFLLLATMGYIYLQNVAQMESEYYANLRSKAFLTAGVAINNLEMKQGKEELDLEPASKLRTQSENIAIYDANDRLVYAFHATRYPITENDLQTIRQRSEVRFRTRDHFGAYGLQYLSASGKPYLLIAEAPIDNSKQSQLFRILLLLFIGLLSLTGAIGWFFAGQALDPVNRIMNQVDIILPSDLSKRLSTPKQKDELGRLASTFNNLLSRIEVAFNAQKMFISNIAHELRNPLTIITTQIEIALAKDRSPEEYRTTLTSILEDTRELSIVSQKLMHIAQLEGDARGTLLVPLRIDELLWQVKNNFLAREPTYKVELEMGNLPEDESELLVKGNESLLKIGLLNLIENACKFSPDHRAKMTLLFRDKHKICVLISDEGAGIQAEEQDLIFEPFYRGKNTTHIKGSGVGLSLVKRIFDLHQVGIEVRPNRPKGTVFQLTFQSISK